MRAVVSTTRLLVVSAATLAILSLQVGSTGCWLAPLEDCYRGMEIGETVEVEFVEPYRREGPYRFWELNSVVGVPSCGALDGIEPGRTLRFQLVERGTQETDCATYWGELRDEVVGVSPLAQPRNGPGFLLGSNNRFDHPMCGDTFWRFFAMRHPELDDDPFGETPVVGEYPPVVLSREINACSCVDRWVGVIRHVETMDAGTTRDARE